MSLRRLKDRKGKVMKKTVVLVIAVLAISLGFASCGKKGGSLKLVNDTDTVYYFKITFDGNDVRVNNGQNMIQPSQTISAASDEDTSYAVYVGGTSISQGSRAAWSGQLSGGETKTLKISEL
jgi:hypothetical protein